MKIYIMTDQEGVAGVINSQDYAAPGARCYEKACELLTLEVNAAIEGAIEAGAEEFLVVDGHGHGSIEPGLLHPRARLLAGRPIGYPFGCDETFDAAFTIGQHAKANTDGGHLCHTGSFEVEDLRINGISVGELGCNALFMGWYGVPLILFTGDKAGCEEAEALIPNIVTVAVKEGLKRGSATGLTGEEARLYNGAAIHLAPEEARRRIREAAAEAIRRRHEVKPFRLDPPYVLESILRPQRRGEPMRRAVVRADDPIELLRAPRIHEVMATEAS